MNEVQKFLSEAQGYLDSGRLAEARAAYQRVCEQDESNAEARLMLGLIEGESGRSEEALAHIRESIQLRPDYEEAYLAQAGVQRAQGDMEAALQSCQAAVYIDSEYEEAWLMFGGIQGALGQYEQAEASCRKVIELWDDCLEAYVNLGGALKAQQKWDEAIDVYRQALKLKPDEPAILVDLGSVYQNKNAWPEAMECCNRVIERDPQNAAAYAGRGSALMLQGYAKDSIPEYEKALELQTGFGEAESGLCSAFVTTEQFGKAKPLCETVIKKFPNSEFAHYNYGRVLQSENRLDEAAACYREALKINFDFARAQFYLGTVNQAQGLYDIALDNFKRVVSILPNFAPGYFHMGLMYQLMRQLDEAVAEFKRVLDINQGGDKTLSANACAQLGYIYKSLFSNKDEAVRYYQMVLDYESGHTAARHYLASLGVGDVPDQASDEYVAKLFDDMSDSFEQSLVNNLNYHTPELIVNAVKGALSGDSGPVDVLDLGCGTGMCGPLIRDSAGHLAGVDLSPKMIEKAEQKKVYDELIVGELTEVMSGSDRNYDVALSADGFVYIGNLDPVFAACAGILKPGGFFALSTEAADSGENEGYALRESGRYAHALGYIRELEQRHNFDEVSLEDTVIHMEGDEPINGRVFVLRKRDKAV